MKQIQYIGDIHYLGERCRLIILFGKIYIAVSRERKRFNFDITI